MVNWLLITYKKSLEHIDAILSEHRTFLDIGYKNNYFLASGPQNPRTGGIIISQLKDRQQLEDFLKQDPFIIQDVADYIGFFITILARSH